MITDILQNDFDVYLYFVFGEHLDNNSTYTNLPITNELVSSIKEICREYASKIANLNQIEDYNIVGANESIIESYDLNNNFMGLPNINSLFANTNRLVNIQDHELKDYRYFIIEVELNEEHFYFIRKPFKPGMLKEGKIISRQRGQFGWVQESDLIAFDDKIDMIISDENILIFNRASFEHAYNFSEIYDYLSFKVLENQTLKDNIQNFDELVIDIDGTETLKRKVASLYNKQNICLFLNKIDVTKKINVDYNLNLTFDGNQIVYEEKSQAKHIIALMQDAYYETYIGEEQGTDSRR
ncbi:TPA: DUF4868 domain-containing protein [Staphylococcus aureus]|uniref:Kiwa anti-phage protein KwaB-like domain-containing protein n=1 Tax=Staphylococcus aureus TaxID=1280 RepID=UPI0006BA80E1|nr:Kiwa anti-phage protein KwaB-like domain-containing protein [Staphylococcus aureus]MBU7372853.1 DUF4868 domain-containing protein [Staphylococcus aureus]MCQ1158474.1 DUF4868 domain-containing protein [Staphylococcus aureus]MCQ1295018.1 DUF4868 domain-containing protein [Staphylococcus aureus]MDT4041004.1 DUF4868 domain-containing protein [Staphylococcus aureus]MDT4067777.1 DUF4868 domain-containing protein [Staphylococcus aureus]